MTQRFHSVFTLDLFCPVDSSSDIYNINSFSDFNEILNDMYGDPGIHVCAGSMEYARYSWWAKTKHLACVASEYFLDKGRISENKIKDNHKYLEIWSNEGIYNKRKYAELLKIWDNTHENLKNHYMKNFDFNENTANEISLSVMENFLSMKTGSYPSSGTLLYISAGLRTPLMYACWQGTVEMVKFLLNKGADHRLLDSDGNTALSYVSVNEKLTDDEKITSFSYLTKNPQKLG